MALSRSRQCQWGSLPVRTIGGHGSQQIKAGRGLGEWLVQPCHSTDGETEVDYS